MRLLYLMVKPPIWFGLRMFYSKVVIKGETNLPIDRPFLILPNHQNALMDVLVVAANLRRNPRFWARADIFKNKKARFWLESLGISPIFRPRDGMDQMSRNDETFTRSMDHLKKGTPYFIFPEGSHGRFPRVRPLKKGWARIAYRVSQETGAEMGFAPVMIHYVQLDKGGVPVEVEIEPLIELDAKGQAEPHFAKDALDKVFTSMTKYSPMADPDSLSEDDWESWQSKKTSYQNIPLSKKADLAFIQKLPIPEDDSSIIFRAWRLIGQLNHFWWIALVSKLSGRFVTDHHFAVTGKFMIFWMLGPLALLLQSLIVGWILSSFWIGFSYWVVLHLILPPVKK
ncbi:MAG: 1-acyl-sn-glycerol-3-phosphate acyltransferase [Bacteroidota bacterium]|nr:1-acyl-sn-glycerol-3-phosphate acyltransferase [Bacteroidota bacterium]